MATKKKSKKAAKSKKTVSKSKSAPTAKKAKTPAKKKVSGSAIKKKAAKKGSSKIYKKKAGKNKKRSHKALKGIAALSQTDAHQDHHLIPLKGETHAIGTNESKQHEKIFEHNQKIAFQREQQRIRNLQNRKGGNRRIIN